MGKGRILQNLGEGLYNVAIVRDLRGINDKINVIDIKINTLTDEIIPDLESQETAAEAAANTARTELNNAIDDYRLGLVGKDEVIAATRNYNQKLAEWQKIVSLLDVKNLEVESLEREKDFLRKSFAAAKTNLQAWCIDGQDDLTGDIGTIEVPGELGRLFIQPGYNSNAAYNTTRDGILQPIMSSTPAGAFLNRGILPGWQKFMPTYRVGTIQSMNEITRVFYSWLDTGPLMGWGRIVTDCTVLLDDARSSAQGLAVNQCQTLINVPIKYSPPWGRVWEWFWAPFPASYTDLSSIHFDPGARVIVKFEGQNWDTPQVIGFESHPKRVYLKIRLFWSADEEIIDPAAHTVSLKFLKAIVPTTIFYDTTIIYNSLTKYWEVTVNEPVWPDSSTIMNLLFVTVDGVLHYWSTEFYPIIYGVYYNT